LCSSSDALGPALYAGGFFDTAGAVSASNIARWSCENQPETYCTAKTNSLGCVPAISSFGIASASLGSGFDVRAANVLNQRNGLLFYGVNGSTASTFNGGWLCVVGPQRRTSVQSSGGAVGTNDCSGAHAYDFNARVASGADPALLAGQIVSAQWYTRDPAASFAVGFTDALEFAILE
jgi:hypothetical protein